VQPPGRHAGVCLKGVNGQRLQQVEEIQPDSERRLLTGLVILLQRGVEPLPPLSPGQRVPVEQLLEVLRALQLQNHRLARLGDGPVTSGVQGHHFLHRHLLTGRDSHDHLLLDQTRARSAAAVVAHAARPSTEPGSEPRWRS